MFSTKDRTHSTTYVSASAEAHTARNHLIAITIHVRNLTDLFLKLFSFQTHLYSLALNELVWLLEGEGRMRTERPYLPSPLQNNSLLWAQAVGCERNCCSFRYQVWHCGRFIGFQHSFVLFLPLSYFLPRCERSIIPHLIDAELGYVSFCG